MQDTPKQCKLLGATVHGVGVVTAVSSTLFDCFAIVEDERGVRHHRFLADLKRDEVTFALASLPYDTAVERIGYGTWDEVYSLFSVSIALEVAA